MILRDIVKAESGTSGLRDPAAWLVEAIGGTPTSSGVRVNGTSALGLPAYFACLRALSEDVAKLPLFVFRRMQPRGKERLRDHPISRLLRKPNPDMQAITFRETMLHYAAGWGGGVAEIARRDGTPDSLWPVHPNRIRIERDGAGLLYLIRSDDVSDMAWVERRPRDVLHIRGLSSEGVAGYSVAGLARESIGLGLAAQRFGASFFGNGSTISGVLKHPKTLGDTAAQHLRESWAKKYSGPENAHKPAILEEGLEYERIGIPPEEAQFIETRQFQVPDICRWFRMPPHKIQDLQRATFSNIEQQSIEYVTDTLMPWLIRWEQEIWDKLLGQDDELLAEHVVEGLLRGDAASRSAAQRTWFEMGIFNRDELREMENRPPIPGGERYYIAGNNLSPINDDGSIEQASAPNPEPPPFGRQEEEPPEEEERAKRLACKLYAATLDRLVTKETRGVVNAAGKKVDDDAYRKSVMDFYEKHWAQVRNAVCPVAEAQAEMRGAVLDEDTLTRIVQEDTIESRRSALLNREGISLWARERRTTGAGNLALALSEAI